MRDIWIAIFAAWLGGFFTACNGRDEIYPFHVANAVKACETHSGWANIKVGFGARCTDGTYIGADKIDAKEP